ncbi:methylmalonyl-CoA mutase family protein, partial [Chloroflexota bacterium]
QQPLNNITRVAIQALACVMGGCQSLCTTSYDEALALPTEESARIAIRTQQIIAHETGVADTADPLGGSYYLEWLTNKIEEGINKYIATIDSMGGAVEAMKKGYMQREILRSAHNYQQAVDSGEQVVIGVNKFTIDEEVNIPLLEIDESVERKQIERLRQLRQERDNEKVRQALDKVHQVARTDENLMPVLIDAVKTYATVGEITDALRGVFGEYKEPNIV